MINQLQLKKIHVGCNLILRWSLGKEWQVTILKRFSPGMKENVRLNLPSIFEGAWGHPERSLQCPQLLHSIKYDGTAQIRKLL
jgi:hypothetical protein